jgi:hypothetical protein
MYRVSTKGEVDPLIQQRVIDTTVQQYYPSSVSLVNLNNVKGEMQLLVNDCYRCAGDDPDGSPNHVFTYTRPADPWKDAWVKTILASDFKPVPEKWYFNNGVGTPYAMWPKVSDQHDKPPHILVAGFAS